HPDPRRYRRVHRGGGCRRRLVRDLLRTAQGRDPGWADPPQRGAEGVGTCPPHHHLRQRGDAHGSGGVVPALRRPGAWVRLRLGIGDGDRPVRGLHLPPPDDDAARAYPSVPVTADQRSGPGPRTGQTTRSRGRSARCAAEGGLTMSDQTREPVKAPRRSLAARLYLGEVGINIADWRRRWLAIAGVLVVIAIL